MSNSNNLAEAVQLLSDGGVLTRLKDEAQSEREAERAALLVRLSALEKSQAEDGAKAEKMRAAAVARIAELEASLKKARTDLAALAVAEAPKGFFVDDLRGKLRRLADPRIGEAIMQLSDLSDQARGAFATRTGRVRRLGGKSTIEINNALPIADVMADIQRTRLELEALQEQQRPDDLDAVIAAKLDPIRLDVRNLRGVQ